MNWGYFGAIMLGIWNSVTMNLAKGMQRHHITIFDKKVKEKNNKTDSKNFRKPFWYTFAIILNQLPFLWAMLANMLSNGVSSYFTSMYGIGLIVLMLYSSKVLKEDITPRKIVGSIVLIIGTILLGIDGIFNPLENPEYNVISSSIFIGVLLVLAVIAIPLSIRTKNPRIIGITFGIICGSFQSLDAVIKGIGQSYGVTQTGFLPGNLIGWIIFLTSFLSGTFSFVLSQVGFSKKTEASVQTPIANSTFIIIPIVVQLISLPGYEMNILTVIGMVVVVTGILLMQLYPQSKELGLNQNLATKNQMPIE